MTKHFYILLLIVFCGCANKVGVISICSYKDSRAFQFITNDCIRCKEIINLDSIPLICIPEGEQPIFPDSFNIYAKICPSTCLIQEDLKKLNELIKNNKLGLIKNSYSGSRNSIIITAYSQKNKLLYTKFVDVNKHDDFDKLYYLIKPFYNNNKTFDFYFEESGSFFEFQ